MKAERGARGSRARDASEWPDQLDGVSDCKFPSDQVNETIQDTERLNLQASKERAPSNRPAGWGSPPEGIRNSAVKIPC